jgi:hypothetical protein
MNSWNCTISCRLGDVLGRTWGDQMAKGCDSSQLVGTGLFWAWTTFNASLSGRWIESRPLTNTNPHAHIYKIPQYTTSDTSVGRGNIEQCMTREDWAQPLKSHYQPTGAGRFQFEDRFEQLWQWSLYDMEISTERWRRVGLYLKKCLSEDA